MEIVKALNLNNTPKDIRNGSIVCAKNMMTDDTTSYLTQDIDIEEVEDFDGGIVGIIPCSSEIVILTGDSKIYRLKDGDTSPVEVNTDWTYEGGTITGGFSYNYRGDLIIVIAESGVPNTKIPLKSFIIKEEDSIIEGETNNYVTKYKSYAIEEKIPLYDSWYQITSDGNLVCGVYTFFIRFKTDVDNYTKWFQITGDIIITQEVLGSTYSHSYVHNDNNENEWHPPFYINSDKVSNKSITVFVDISDIIGDDHIDYDSFQLAYIIKRENDVQARIEGDYKVNKESYNEIFVSDNNWQEVISVEELVENPHPFFNVENVEVYNNRLYVANYEENDVVDYSSYARAIRISGNSEVLTGDNVNQTVPEGYHLSDILITVEQYLKGFINYGPSEHKVANIFKRNWLLSDDGNLIPADKNGELINELLNLLYLQVWVLDDYHRAYTLNDVGKLYLNGNTYHNDKIVTSTVSGYWMIFDKHNHSDNICIYRTINGTTINIDGIDLDITLNLNVPSYRIGFDNDLGLFIRSNNKNYYLFDTENYTSFILGCEHHSFTQNNEASDYLYLGNRQGEPLVDELINPTNVDAAFYLAINDDDSDIIIKSRISEASNPNSDPEGNINTDGGVSFLGSNTRSLIPRQLYNFFIHYIRKDGSVTPGYNIGTAKFLSNGGVIIPSFIGITKPANSDVVGYFISYEEVERNADCVYITSYDSDKTKMTNALQLYNIENYYIKGSTIWIDDTKYVVDETLIKYIENRLIENHVEVNDDLAEAAQEKLATFIRYIHNQYNKEAKTLYRLTKNNYHFSNDVVIADKDYLPDFYQKQIIIYYGDNLEGLIIDPANTKVFKVDFGDSQTDVNTQTTYHVYMIFPKMYSPYPTEAMSVKDDFIKMGVLLEYGNNGETKKEIINSVISPDKLHDYLELKGAYLSKPSKVYTNYNENNISRFDKTVYRSDVISDESLVNGFRHFTSNNYKNILENKGKITNIVGIGFYLIVHTEYSMFVFDRTPKLTSQATLHIPDTFDTEYQEVMPSNEGFGGLRNKDEAILTKHGYIWYDYNNKYIFNYENGKTEIISNDINNFIKHLNVIDVRFAEDIIHSRLIICFHILVNNTNEYVTLSYNLATKSYISFHDYIFSHNYRTYNTSYLIKEYNTKKLYKYVDTHNANYTGLYRANSFLAPTYRIINNLNQNFKSKSYVDIIYNDAFAISKSLESISYILNKIVDEVGEINIADVLTRSVEDITNNLRYSGDSLLIYSDETQSGELNIHVPGAVNQFDEYKYPVYNKGAWQLNYFRNTINPRLPSDDASLIYGKYIVVRFIFNNINRVKLETITFNTNPY